MSRRGHVLVAAATIVTSRPVCIVVPFRRLPRTWSRSHPVERRTDRPLASIPSAGHRFYSIEDTKRRQRTGLLTARAHSEIQLSLACCNAANAFPIIGAVVGGSDPKGWMARGPMEKGGGDKSASPSPISRGPSTDHNRRKSRQPRRLLHAKHETRKGVTE